MTGYNPMMSDRERLETAHKHLKDGGSVSFLTVAPPQGEPTEMLYPVQIDLHSENSDALKEAVMAAIVKKLGGV